MENFADLVEATLRMRDTYFDHPPAPPLKVVKRGSEEHQRLTKEGWTTLGEGGADDTQPEKVVLDVRSDHRYSYG